ncbi:MAG: hypothetical protein KME20_06340 [Kaiparowitsia implicata GSE-PSE-MK54-09C]|jgi:hypothetical protein|nr:hypothetical protein [Kaiparowitsia implicata GSE-PSE-MK54-09C]
MSPSSASLSFSPAYTLWDFAGRDGLQAALQLFGPRANRIAPFQSFSTSWQQQPCTVLRLCQHNFRVALPEGAALDLATQALDLSLWVKPCATLATVFLPRAEGLERLPNLATTNPLYRLDPLPLDCAVPARIGNCAVLIWHHTWNTQPYLAIQTVTTQQDFIRQVVN